MLRAEEPAPTMVEYLIANGLFLVQSRGASPNYGGIFLAGCVGGAAQIFIACPVELIKGRNH